MDNNPHSSTPWRISDSHHGGLCIVNYNDYIVADLTPRHDWVNKLPPETLRANAELIVGLANSAALSSPFTEEEIDTIIEAVEYRNQRVSAISGLPDHMRGQLLNKYDAVLTKLEQIKGEMK